MKNYKVHDLHINGKIASGIVRGLTYKRETYLIFVKHDGKFHNKLWECEKEIPSELEWFCMM